ncbi:hypothetical protein LCGC14_0928180 [marine sediment metagenome]|uniref:Uncharacterized protein n=1 Tax=marine sediment metagenome TaxID=412755 RepID=A0A0F9P9M8_9ZZZZ
MKRYLLTFLLVLGLASPSLAATRYKRAIFINATGGLNTNASTLMVPKEDLTHATNVEFTLLGIREKRRGSSKLNSLPIVQGHSVTGLFEWEKSTGSRNFYIASTTGIIHQDVSGVFTERAAGFSTNANRRWTWANWLGTRLVGCNGDTFAQTTTDGSAWTTLTTTPATCLAPIAHRRRLFILEANSSIVYYSALNDPTDFAGAGSGSFQIASTEGGFLTGVASHLGVLVIFKERSIHILYGDSPTSTDPDPFVLKPLVIGVGAVSHNSIQTVTGQEGTDLLFASKDGIVSLKNIQEFGDFRPSLITEKIKPDFRGLSSSRLKLSSAAFYPRKGQYYFAAAKSGSSENDIILKYTILNKAWSIVHSSNAHNILGVKRDTATEDLIVYSGDDDGYVWQLDDNSFNDDGVAFEASYSTPWLDMGRPSIKKSFGPKLLIFHEAVGDYNLTVSWSIDFATPTSTTINMSGGCAALGSFILGQDRLCVSQDITTTVVPVSIRGDGYWIKFDFANSIVDERFSIFGFALEYAEMEE